MNLFLKIINIFKVLKKFLGKEKINAKGAKKRSLLPLR